MGNGDGLRQVLRQAGRKLTLVDVGARWGVNPNWAGLEDLTRIICFEPDPAECQRLSASAPPNITYVPTALAEVNGPMPLWITVDPACTSRYRPHDALVATYPALTVMRPKECIELDARSLDDVLASEGLPAPDVIKLDTQGSELDILRGTVGNLAACSAIDVEVEFNALYEGAHVFADVDTFLRGHGFSLWKFVDIAHHETRVAGIGNPVMVHGDGGRRVSAYVGPGRLFWGQAHYVRTDMLPENFADFCTGGRTKADAYAAISAAAQLGDLDLAIAMTAAIDGTPAAEELSRVLTPREPRTLLQRLARKARRLVSRQG